MYDAFVIHKIYMAVTVTKLPVTNDTRIALIAIIPLQINFSDDTIFIDELIQLEVIPSTVTQFTLSVGHANWPAQ